MTEHRTTRKVGVGRNDPIFFEDNQPSSMEWVKNMGAMYTFDVNLNERLTVDDELAQVIAGNAPLAGKTLLLFGSDPYDVRAFDVPEFLVEDMEYMDTNELVERCPGFAE